MVNHQHEDAAQRLGKAESRVKGHRTALGEAACAKWKEWIIDWINVIAIGTEENPIWRNSALNLPLDQF